MKLLKKKIPKIHKRNCEKRTTNYEKKKITRKLCKHKRERREREKKEHKWFNDCKVFEIGNCTNFEYQIPSERCSFS